MADRSTRILCINCNICVNKLRRYPALELDTRVTSLLCSWVYPQIIMEDDVVCEICLDLTTAVNDALQDFGSADQRAEQSRRIRTDVCLLCGCSTARRQLCTIGRQATTDMQQSIINIIESRVAPREITASDHVCIACWLRTKREVERSNNLDLARSQHNVANEPLQEQQPSESNINSNLSHSHHVTEVVLSNYRRAANSNNHCVFPHCHSKTLHGIPDKLRAQVLSNHNYYLPHLTRVCYEHLVCNSWNILYDSENSFKNFNVKHIEHVFSFVNAFNP